MVTCGFGKWFLAWISCVCREQGTYIYKYLNYFQLFHSDIVIPDIVPVVTRSLSYVLVTVFM